MRVRQLTIYPVKSTAGLVVDQAEVQPWGLAGDRRWAVVDGAGGRVVSWRHHRMLTIRAEPTSFGLRLSAPDRASLNVPYPDPANRVTVGHTRLDTAALADPHAADWLSDLLGFPVRLVWLDDPRLRPMSLKHGGQPGEPLSLADAGPLLLTTQASLDQLNDWIDQRRVEAGEPISAPLAMQRFRPNVVVDGELAFAEDGWHRFRIGSVPFRQAEQCDRCVVTTIDPQTLATGKEPIRTLARYRRHDGKTWFGIRLVPQGTGTLRVGDRVEVG